MITTTVTLRMGSEFIQVTGTYTTFTEVELIEGDTFVVEPSFDIERIRYKMVDITQLIDVISNRFGQILHKEYDSPIRDDLWLRIERDCIKVLSS